ncbi:PREDICTED: uncharacterized protein LOC104707030 [Camelina sativa]|uniref:Uncharacterized protein LOC104707030 n=1 Tax=Camelina sativa TaxID=90675 RepID=A0ABM0T6H0_CAMSA|nr:PREDICTED: uncharacterized protein LOC104707030 [Camelina sativa]
MVLQLGLSGQPLSGPDIGGFAGNATPRLFGRWMGVGAMFPFCRGHSEAGTDDHEPWSFGEEVFFGLFPSLSSTLSNQGSHELQHILPRGTWLRFDFEDSHPDLPSLYLQGGSIISLAPPHLHVGEFSMSDDLTLLVSLDENGKAKGLLFEDDGDGYGYIKGRFLVTHYIAERHSSTVTVKVLKTEGDWQRPTRRVHVQLLLGGGAMLDAWGTDGEIIHIKNFQIFYFGCLQFAGVQWLHSRIDISGYEEYSGTEYRSAGCTEEYSVIERDLEHAGEEESLILEGDIGGGLILRRKISIPKDNPRVFRIASSIEARSVGAGSGGFSRLVCLRVHPTFYLMHPTETFVSFTSIDGSKHEVWPDSGDQLYAGNSLPHGEWMLVDKSLNLRLVNRFDVSQVFKCIVHWDCGTVNLELWSEDRPVSKESPLKIDHEYEVTNFP